jgi:hypothetical protein
LSNDSPQKQHQPTSNKKYKLIDERVEDSSDDSSDEDEDGNNCIPVMYVLHQSKIWLRCL